MMATMINNDHRQESYLVVVIQPDNLARMRKHDPVTFETQAMHGFMPPAKYPDRMAVLIAYEEDEVALYKAAQTGDYRDMLRFLERGYKFDRDEDGTERAFSINKGRQADKH